MPRHRLLALVLSAGGAALAQEPTPSFSFAVLADVQYADKATAGRRHYRTALTKLTECVTELNRRDLAFAIQLGDLIDDGKSSLDIALARWRQLRTRGYHVLGNHDFALPRTAVLDKLGLERGYYDFAVQGWRFVVLDGMELGLHGYADDHPNRTAAAKMLAKLRSAKAKNARTWNGGISATQLAWLDGVLADATANGQRVVVCGHFPLLAAASSAHHLLWNHEDVLAVLEAHSCVVAYLNGHDHGGGYAERRGIHHVTLFGMLEAPVENAYAVVDAHPDRLELRGIGRQKSLTLPVRTRGSESPPRVTTLSDPSIPYRPVDAPTVRIEHGKLSALLADNRASTDHAAGYNGLVELRYGDGPSPFVRRYAGLNLEHVNNGKAYPSRDLQFEPRRHPMQLRRIDAQTYELYQAALPNTGLESCTRFAFVAPDAIDVTFECIPRRDEFPHDHLNLFWASYIDRPASKSIWFRGRDKGGAGERWIEGITPRHGVEATHRSANDSRRFEHDEPFPLSLVFSESNHEYTRPFYYGRYRDHVWIVMFRERDLVRLTQSPSGGGPDNPAWDFQWFIDQPQKDRLYRLVWRAVYKPWVDHEDVLARYEQFVRSTR